MAITFEYDGDKKVIMIKIVGEITAEEYSNLMNVELPSKGVSIDANAIWDLSELDFSVVDIVLERKIVKVREQLDEKRKGVKVALVSNYDLGEPVLKMFLIISQHLSQELRVVRTMEEAKEWLCEE